MELSLVREVKRRLRQLAFGASILFCVGPSWGLLTAVAEDLAPQSNPTVSASMSEEAAAIQQLYQDVEAGKILPDDFSDKLIAHFINPKTVPANLPELRIKQTDLEELFATHLERQLSTFLDSHNASEALGLKRLADLALDTTGLHFKKIESLLSLTERVESLIEKGDVNRLVSIREDAASKTEQALVEPRLTKYLAELAETNLEQRPDLSLKYLAELKSEWSGKLIPTLASKAVSSMQQIAERGIGRLPGWPFDDPRVGKLFQSDELRNDGKLISLIAELHAQRILQLVSEDNAERAGYFFAQLLHFRPDPDAQNNSLRLAIARAAKGPKVKNFALARVTELERAGEIGSLTKFRLALSGFYGAAIPVIFYTLIVLFSGIAALVVFKPEWLGLAGEQVNRGYLRSAEVEDERSRLLRTLGVEEDASDEVIKAAYRNMAKECHPDRLKDIPEAERDEKAKRFVQVNKAYERLIERDRSGFRR